MFVATHCTNKKRYEDEEMKSVYAFFSLPYSTTPCTAEVKKVNNFGVDKRTGFATAEVVITGSDEKAVLGYCDPAMAGKKNPNFI